MPANAAQLAPGLVVAASERFVLCVICTPNVGLLTVNEADFDWPPALTVAVRNPRVEAKYVIAQLPSVATGSSLKACVIGLPFGRVIEKLTGVAPGGCV